MWADAIDHLGFDKPTDFDTVHIHIPVQTTTLITLRQTLLWTGSLVVHSMGHHRQYTSHVDGSADVFATVVTTSVMRTTSYWSMDTGRQMPAETVGAQFGRTDFQKSAHRLCASHCAIDIFQTSANPFARDNFIVILRAHRSKLFRLQLYVKNGLNNLPQGVHVLMLKNMHFSGINSGKGWYRREHQTLNFQSIQMHNSCTRLCYTGDRHLMSHTFTFQATRPFN